MKRGVALVATTLLTLAVSAGAQESHRVGKFCWSNPAPRESCRAIAVTNWGAYAITSTATGSSNDYGHGSHLRVTADWGLLVPSGARSAVGGSVLASLDADGFIIGPAVRYRRWSADEKSSIEVALGVPLSSSRYDANAAVFGLIKWNPNRIVGISLRPEIRRTYDYNCFYVEPYTCDPFLRKQFTLSAGIEIAGAPGAILTGATTLGGFLLLLAYLGSAD